MNKFILCITVGLLSCGAIAQVEDLRRAQEQRKKYINPGLNVAGPSKTLLVNPFVGTGGHGHTFPGAVAPFGMMQLSPDTRYDGWDGCSGYHYSDSIIYGFSHTHLSGTGVPDYCDVLIVPQSGSPKIDPGYTDPANGYGSTFSHENENAQPGYYDVHLDGENVDVRLTVSERCGMHEYTFKDPEGKRFILIDLDHRDKLLSGNFNLIDKKTIQGFRISQSWANEQHFYFHLELDVPYQKARLFQKDGRNKLLLIFPTEVNKVTIKIGMSAVDQKGAKNNLTTEIPHWNFDQARADVNRKWTNELSKINFATDDKEVLSTFYTALYHSFLAPNVFNDVDGRYRGRDLAIHSLDPAVSQNYTVFSLWDTYRATHPLFTITQQKRTEDFISTFLRQYNEGGDLPVWELAGNETECMIGYHSVSVIADALSKGIKGFDYEAMKKALIATSTFDEFAKQSFGKNGYISTGDEPESVSKTLEYSYDDFCIYQYLLQDPKPNQLLIDTYKKRSMNFVNLFDPSTKFMRGRRSGQWFSPFDPAEVNFNYTEANSWQYSLYAPHAVGVLSTLLGGKDSLEMWLDRLFTTESNLSGRHQVDITGLIGQYAHGNEPSHHMAYLYNYTNAPHKTQMYVDRIMKEMYSNAPDGLSGNEDCGQMSSWYVLSALGLYQIAPGNPTYEIGRPLMNNASLQLENGKTFTINCINNSDKNMYVQNVTLNGKRIAQNYLNHSDIMNGGVLELTMGSKPVLERKSLTHAPTIEEIPADFVPTPFIEQESRVFDASMEISLGMVFPENFSIYYTLDGSEPDAASTKYSKPFKITKNTTVKAIAIGTSGKSSVISNDFVQRDKNVSIELKSTYANQYAAGGKYTVIDGIRGNNEYRTGDWQGYWEQDFVAEVNFTQPRELKAIGIGCLSDMKSWIFLPSEVTVEVSFDGQAFTSIGKIKNTAEDQSMMAPHHLDYEVTTKTNIPVRKIRITLKSAGQCPTWHLGAGNPTWLFVDEITFR